MPPDKHQGPPGGSRPPNGHKKVAPVERPELTTARNPEQMFAALRYAAMIGPVFPVRRYRDRDGKLKLKPRFSRARNNGLNWGMKIHPDEIRADFKKYPHDLVGVATGYIGHFFTTSRRKYCVIDIDRKNGKDGYLWIAEMQARGLNIPRTATYLTEHGEHLLFTVSDTVRLKSSTSEIAPGIDVRCDGGFVIAPSVLQLGGEGRVWKDSCAPANLEDTPWLFDALTRDRRAALVEIDPALASVMRQDGGKGVSADPDDLPKPRTFAPDNVPVKAPCAMSVIPADPYHDWVRIGMALFAALRDSEDPEVRDRAAEIGYEIFDLWSKTSKKYDPEAVHKKWFEECVKVHSLGAGTLYGIADDIDRRWRDDYANMIAGRRS